MSSWRFTLTDRNGATLQFNSPPGWDKNITDIKRDLDWHGVFFNREGQNLQYHDKPGQWLKAEYDQYGVQGIMYLTIEEECDGEWLTNDTGKFVFGAYKYFCGPECYVTCPLEAISAVMDLRNRMNQKVDLEKLVAFDGATALPPYAGLAMDLLLPSKGILLQDLASNEEVFSTPVQGVGVNDNPGSGPFNNSEYGMISFGVDKIIASEIGSFSFGSQPLYNCVLTNAGSFGCPLPLYTLWMYPDLIPTPDQGIRPLDLSPALNYADGTTNFGIVSDVGDLDVNLHLDFTQRNCTTLIYGTALCVLPGDKDGTAINHYHWLAVNHNSSSLVYHDPAFVLNRGDRIYAFVYVYHYKTEAQTLDPTPAFDIATRAGDFFNFKTLTHTDPTKSKVFLINEAFSRVAESITNNKLKVYSDLYGREDSEPYQAQSGVDGCGSRIAITNGLRIRRAENRIPGQPSVYSVSLEDLWNGMNPIHNIGMGVEPDTFRPGFDRLRIEDWRFFYKNDVVLQTLNVPKITRSCYAKNIYSTFKFGYQKWEAEQYNGLDEFLTQRYYRTGLSQVKNDLVKLSTFVSSGYALEITRRLGNDTSQDWRYDNDTFPICLQRGKYTIVVNNTQMFAIIIPGIPGLTGSDSLTISGTGPDGIDGTYALTFPIYSGGQTTTSIFPASGASGTFYGDIAVNGTPQPSNVLSVEFGNISGPANIIDPDTIYNWRIRPIYCAMRWMNWILQSYKQFNNNSKIEFMDGQANYHALGEMLSTFCKLENQPISEDDMLNLQKFADIEDCKPELVAERVEYSYPMSTREYLALKAQPYGLIHFTGGECEDGYGHIDTIKYDKDAGMANFLLIPKILPS